ncbi:MAG: CPXCG motif-containing cysteine-rich protein [Bacteroidota bacterium]
MEEEVFFACPYCFAQISMLVDPTISAQTYIEDCEVCCNPIQIRYTADETLAVTSFQADSIEQ